MNDVRASMIKAIVTGGFAAAVLDGLDAIVAYKVVLGFDPIPIYQFVASGMLGPSAFEGGVATALVGLGVHFLVAFGAASAYVFGSRRFAFLTEHAGIAGAWFGVAVFLFMNYAVIPLSLIAPSPFSWSLFLNGVIGHALFVGLPIAYAARRYLARSSLPPLGTVAEAT